LYSSYSNNVMMGTENCWQISHESQHRYLFYKWF